VPPVIFRLAASPKLTLAPVKDAFPDTFTSVSVPVLVIFGWALAVTVIAVEAAAADTQLNPPEPFVDSTCPADPPNKDTVPLDPKLTSCPLKFALPETLRPVSVPTLVMLG
jgi:hypothetical protein